MSTKRTTIFLIALTAFVFSVHGVSAQTPPPLPDAVRMMRSSVSLNQSVSVSVQEINELSISGDVTMRIDTAAPGGAPVPATNALSTYDVTVNGVNRKITGMLDTAFTAGITLDVLLSAPSGATATEQTLSTVPVDLVTGLGLTASTGLPITYTAEAAISVPPNASGETRTVTFTLTAN